MMTGTLILLCGLPGSGKTTMARQMELERNAIRLCADEWIYEFLEEKEDIREMDRLRNPVEQELWKLAKRLLVTGSTVILENGFWSKTERDGYRDGARNLGAKVELHYLKTDLNELKSRLEDRNKQNLPGTFEIPMENIEQWYQEFEAPNTEELAQYTNGS